VAGDDRIRLFCALRLPEQAVAELVAWQARRLPGGVRTVEAGNLHVTLAFLGSRPASDVGAVARELRAAAAAAAPVTLRPERYRETRSVAMIVYADEGGAATALADEVGERLERLGVYRREERPWLPHVTVARFRERPRLDPPVDGLCAISPSDAAVYSSVLRPAGAQYVVLERTAVGAGTQTTGGR
jgi:RNA 2',3'-cyclic 3'-phosphodiesterase